MLQKCRTGSAVPSGDVLRFSGEAADRRDVEVVLRDIQRIFNSRQFERRILVFA